MERFAFKIDAALKANLYKICRLCGIDNPGKVQILLPDDGDTIDLDEPCLSQKIYDLIGFVVGIVRSTRVITCRNQRPLQVSSTDKMPQTMCSLCVDKINDFYEFREMCYATNKQTRNLLGLKQMEPAKLVDLKATVKEELQLPGPSVKRGRKRKTEYSWPKSNMLNAKQQVKKEPLAWHKKLRLQQVPKVEPKIEPEIKEEYSDLEALSLRLPPKKGGRKSICSVCGEKFFSKELADEHKSLVHVPSIPRYICNACNQTHHSQSDIRAHQLWHKLSKTPYKCPLCDESVANAYAFARHLRVHTPPTPVEQLVLDRECPLCKKTFVTNFFFNTHRCAIRKRRCGGCNRVLNTEAAYMRHAPGCSGIYLNHSKHIMPEVVSHESQMQIKNEVEDFDLAGLPPATALPPDFVIDEEMQPVVVLERLSSPLLRASAEVNRLGTSRGKNSDRVSAKNYLKRVDQLLKNTMSTLVSIKNEPEVHINDTGPAEQSDDEAEQEREDAMDAFGDDFQAGNDDSEEEQEPGSSSKEATTESSDNMPSVSVKLEPLDGAYEKQLEVKQEPLKLKLKITKNHGKLNSSLVDDLDEAGQGKGSKKKKKRKHREREKESPPHAIPDQSVIRIKQEPIDRDAALGDYAPEATVMTTIPMTQLEINYNELGQQEAARVEEDGAQDQEDVKPNRMELDRLMQISHVASGVVMAEEAIPLERAVEATPDEAKTDETYAKESPSNESPPKPKTVKSTARKSTGGATQRQSEPPKQSPLPQIVAVESGEAVAFNMVSIKPEPSTRGYAGDEPEEEQPASDEINHNEKLDEGSVYIRSLDLNSVSVKQENDLDLDISDEPTNVHCNGLDKSNDSEDEDDGNEESLSSADEAEEAMEEDEEERIYREIELPPLETQHEVEQPSHTAQGEPLRDLSAQEHPPETSEATVVLEPKGPAFNLVITNICSQAKAPGPPQAEITPSLENPQPIANDSSLLETLETNQTTTPLENDVPAVIVSNLGLDSNFNLAITEVQSMTEDEQPVVSGENPSVGDANSAFSNLAPDVDSDSLPSVSSNRHIFGEPGPAISGNHIQPHSSPSKEPLDKPDIETIALDAPKDSEALAIPTQDDPIVDNNYACDEEVQNVLNHELQQQMPLEEEGQLAPQVAEILPGPSTGPNEETENRINEHHQQQQELQELEPEDQRQLRCPAVNDDSNINEIAENNNNANIERELQDDALGAQENGNP
ncbi:hypothetical protein KR009_007064 [Drosophila setifemur]|nr:hypothetical protein KR009_007064 [Drosophila setifemur]